MGAAPAYMDRRLETTMLVIPTTLKTFGGRNVPATNENNCAQALRPTFAGWGPKI